MFDKIKEYYTTGLWSLDRVWNVVGKDKGITEEQYNEITGFAFPEKE